MTRRGRAILVALAVVMGIALVAEGVGALALPSGIAGPGFNVIKGTPRPDKLVGTNRRDKILGRGAGDEIKGRGAGDVLKGGKGGDVIGGGKGFDKLMGGPGNDRINARDGRPDEIDCGDGNDFAKVDRNEDGVYNCETVRSPRGPN
jgi:RTX calcium-binding nonapeptide repeat (4 copies)